MALVDDLLDLFRPKKATNPVAQTALASVVAVEQLEDRFHSAAPLTDLQRQYVGWSGNDLAPTAQASVTPIGAGGGNAAPSSGSWGSYISSLVQNVLQGNSIPAPASFQLPPAVQFVTPAPLSPPPPPAPSNTSPPPPPPAVTNPSTNAPTIQDVLNGQAPSGEFYGGYFQYPDGYIIG